LTERAAISNASSLTSSANTSFSVSSMLRVMAASHNYSGEGYAFRWGHANQLNDDCSCRIMFMTASIRDEFHPPKICVVTTWVSDAQHTPDRHSPGGRGKLSLSASLWKHNGSRTMIRGPY
jgi:hypothetical protein